MPLIDAGQPAPDFSLLDQDGKARSLRDFAGHPLVVYFYPKDDTGVCTSQACDFRDHLPDFKGVHSAVVGISPDDQASHAAFAGKNKLAFPLLSDIGRDPLGQPAVASAYGAWGEKTMYGRTSQGVVRTTYLIDAEGKVAKRWDNVRVRGHADEVLDAIDALERGELKEGEAVPADDTPGKPRRSTRAARTDPKFTAARGQGPNSAAQAPPRAGAGRAQKGK